MYEVLGIEASALPIKQHPQLQSALGLNRAVGRGGSRDLLTHAKAVWTQLFLMCYIESVEGISPCYLH